MQFKLLLLGALASLTSSLVIRSSDPSFDLLARDLDSDLIEARDAELANPSYGIFARDAELDFDLLEARDEDFVLFPRGKISTPKTSAPRYSPYKSPSVFKQISGGKHDTPVPKGCSGAYCDHANKVVLAAYGNNLKQHADHKLSHPAVGQEFYPHAGTPAQRKAATTKQRYEATKGTKTQPGMARDEFPWASVDHSEPHTSVRLLPASESRVEGQVMNQANAQAHKYGYPIKFKDNRSRKRSLDLEDYLALDTL
jgi:hypothetical protein